MCNTSAPTGELREPVSLEALKHLVVSASRLMPKADVLELADALHDALRERRCLSDALVAVIRPSD